MITEFTPQNRGGKGVKCYKITEKTGNIIGMKAVNDEDEIMIITIGGIIIRMHVNDISVLGRITSGVKLIDLDEDITVASIAKVREEASLMDDAAQAVENAEDVADELEDTEE